MFSFNLLRIHLYNYFLLYCGYAYVRILRFKRKVVSFTGYIIQIPKKPCFHNFLFFKAQVPRLSDLPTKICNTVHGSIWVIHNSLRSQHGEAGWQDLFSRGWGGTSAHCIPFDITPTK